MEDNKLKLRGTVCTINWRDSPGLCMQAQRNSQEEFYISEQIYLAVSVPGSMGLSMVNQAPWDRRKVMYKLIIL